MKYPVLKHKGLMTSVFTNDLCFSPLTPQLCTDSVVTQAKRQICKYNCTDFKIGVKCCATESDKVLIVIVCVFRFSFFLCFF